MEASRRHARRIAAVDSLAALADEIGVSLPQLAVAWAMNDPGVTSVIICVRNLEQLNCLLPAVDLSLDDVVLDRIDDVVSPGTTLDPNDSGDPWLYGSPVRREVGRQPETDGGRISASDRTARPLEAAVRVRVSGRVEP